MPGDRGYMPQLDGLRAFAVMAVLVFHWFKPPFALGQWGVMLFFVLSGYLITRNIAALKAAGLPTLAAARVFFVRRTLRLFPAYYLVVLIAALLFEDIRRDWAWYVGYVSNLLMELRHQFGPLKASWSLSVEEQFYIVWFFVVMAVPARRLPWIMALAFVAAPLTRCTWLAPDHPTFRTWTLWANCDGLAVGAFLSRLEASGKALPLSRGAVIAMTVAVAVLTATLSPQSPGYSAIAGVLVVVIAGWLVWHARHPLGGIAGAVLSHPWVVWLGRISYGVYLYHVIAPALVHAAGLAKLPLLWRLFQPGTVHGFVVHGAITIALAALSFRYVETPMRRLAFRRPPGLTANSVRAPE